MKKQPNSSFSVARPHIRELQIKLAGQTPSSTPVFLKLWVGTMSQFQVGRLAQAQPSLKMWEDGLGSSYFACIKVVYTDLERFPKHSHHGRIKSNLLKINYTLE